MYLGMKFRRKDVPKSQDSVHLLKELGRKLRCVGRQQTDWRSVYKY